MFDNKSFYPTPPTLITKMLGKIKGHPGRALEPSAGKGDIIDGINNSFRFSQYNKPDFSTIEIDPILQATLRGKGIKVIDTDFLEYSGLDKFDLIIANPPFDEGDKHLLKAIEIMYRGEIVFLLNAETLKNPCTNIRKLLVRKLEELNADIEYIQDSFMFAERKTRVEVALIYINIDRKIEDDLFAGCDETAYRKAETVTDSYEVSTGKTIFELVADYNDIIQTGQETILGYFRNIRKIGAYLSLNQTDSRDLNRYASAENLTTKMQATLNTLIADVRKAFWRKTLDLKEVRSRLTQKKSAEFEIAMGERCHMDFTENNIRQFVLNLIGGYEQTLIDAVVDTFDRFTIRHTWSEDNRHEKNIHYFNGWKTNKAFKVGKRVIIPIRGGHRGAFVGYSGQWDLTWDAAESLRDIDIVMNYFDGMKDFVTLPDAITKAFAAGDSSGESTYFKFICHKKGTIHLTFRDEDILRRFNVVACRGKGWLPGDFGAKPYLQLSAPERSVVDSFEGEKSYNNNINVALFGRAAVPQLELLEAA